MALKSPAIAITMGDPLGIGPEIIVKSLLDPKVRKGAQYHVIGARQIFAGVRDFDKVLSFKNVTFVDINQPGKPSAQNSGSYAVNTLRVAVELLRSKRVRALVTAPISKDRVRAAGFNFPGHTEFLCHEFAAKKFAMMLFHPKLRVVLTTIHLPLKDVAAAVTQEAIVEKLALMTETLTKTFGIKKPRLGVCGLNPHAGEYGMLGTEEMTVIAPAIATFLKSRKGVSVFGPLPADTAFHEAISGKYDAVLCQYHDQGLIPLKTTDFYHGVNMTLGLPFIRTSPDHGTAFDIAGKNLAKADSMAYAITAARDLL